nr:MAG TPA: hypothetical protein [Caudoviricetes sp.]DAQ56007.1 MAG TPA: hypothetical protein [Caudoviricetes sp.]
MSTYNIRSVTLDQFMKMPGTVRYELLERFRIEYEITAKANPMQAEVEKLL